MYIQELSIDIRTTVNKDELIDAFGSLMSFYRGSGQTQGRIESQYIANDKLVCLPYTLEENSLDTSFDNQYVTKQREKLEDLCQSELTYKTVGKSYDSYMGPCQCQKPECYVLITNYVTIESPLTCGTCNKSVPLYRLPPYYDFGYLPILSWETNYISCDRLQMNCEVGERWALNQLQEVTSPLSRQGLEICRKIEELTSIPTYYYLYNYKKFKGDESTRPCPGCNNPWNLEKRLHDHFDFQCDRCKLVSTISPNT